MRQLGSINVLGNVINIWGDFGTIFQKKAKAIIHVVHGIFQKLSHLKYNSIKSGRNQLKLST